MASLKGESSQEPEAKEESKDAENCKPGRGQRKRGRDAISGMLMCLILTWGLPFVAFLNFLPQKSVLLFAIQPSSGSLGETWPSKRKALGEVYPIDYVQQIHIFAQQVVSTLMSLPYHQTAARSPGKLQTIYLISHFSSELSSRKLLPFNKRVREKLCPQRPLQLRSDTASGGIPLWRVLIQARKLCSVYNI